MPNQRAQTLSGGGFRQRPPHTGKIEPVMLVHSLATPISRHGNGHLSAAKWLPAMPLVAPMGNIRVFSEWSPLAIWLAPVGANIYWVGCATEEKYLGRLSVAGVVDGVPGRPHSALWQLHRTHGIP